MTNDSLKSYVAIEPYDSSCECHFTELELRTMYWKGRGVAINVQPVERTPFGVSCIMMGVSAEEMGMIVKRIPMARFNAKQLENIHADLVGMKDKIAELWNKRDFEGIKNLFN